VARAVTLVPDLLFGSRVQSSLTGAGHEVLAAASPEQLRSRLDGADRPLVLVVDLTDEQLDGAGVLEALRAEGRLEDVRALGFYSHVDTAARERAEGAGFDLVVPRSRMAREAGQLVERLATPTPEA
jgi:CheY-like chemotaxis protein